MHKRDHAFVRPTARRGRGRLSLPLTDTSATATPPATRPLGAQQYHTLPRPSQGRGRKDRDADDKPGAAMFDRLFSALPLPTSVKREPEDMFLVPQQQQQSPYQEHAVDRTLTRPMIPTANLLDFDDETDEISILGVETSDMTPDPHRACSTPDRFLDDISMKMESPANLSITKLFDELDPSAFKTSPLQAVSDLIRAASVLPAGDEIAGVFEAIEDRVGEVAGDTVADPEGPVGEPEQATSSPPDAPLETGIDSEESEVVTTSQTPQKLHVHLPFAEEEFINTPARPIEDMHYHELQVSTPRASKIPIITPKKSPLHKEDAFIDSPVSLKQADVLDTEPKHPVADDSFASTVVDLANDPTIVPIRLKCDRGQGSRSEDIDQTRMGDGRDGASSPRVNESHGLEGTLSGARSPQQQLGSAIRMGQSTLDSSTNDVRTEQDRPLIVRASTLTLSSPRKARKASASASKSPRPVARPTTPISGQRRFMDIPLSRLDPTIELWQNPSPILRPPRDRSPSPNLEPIGTRTPPPRERMAMDIPLSRNKEPEEIWHEAGPNARRRPRRTLLSPEPRSRSHHSAQLVVDESPKTRQTLDQETAQDALSKRATAGLPVVPKLDFGVGLTVIHARSLSEDDDIALNSLTAQPADEGKSMNEPDLMQEIAPADTSVTGLVLRDPRVSNSAHATPRVSKLRRLARTLEQSTERSLTPEEDETDLNSPQWTPRTARRKDLSDDIDLDFSNEAGEKDRQEQAEPLEEQVRSEQAEQLEVPQEDATEGQYTAIDDPLGSVTPGPEPAKSRGQSGAASRDGIATPVFTLRRKRKAPGSPIDAASIRESETDEQRARKRGARRTSRAGDDLATFGVVPEVLPRTRRERKKPAEYWKISQTPPPRDTEVKVAVKSEDGKERSQQLVTKAVKERIAPRDASPALLPPPTPPPPTTKPKEVKMKRKLRPSDIVGPVSSRHKIMGPSWATKQIKDKSAIAKKAKVHNFEDSE